MAEKKGKGNSLDRYLIVMFVLWYCWYLYLVKQSSNRFHFLKFWNCNFWEHTLLILQPKDDNHVTPLPLWKILDLSLLPVVYLQSYCYSYLTYATLSIKTSEELKSLGTIKNAWILIIFAEDCKFLGSRSSIVQALCCLNSYNFQCRIFLLFGLY